MEEKQRSNEWYTPAKYIEAAREVMDGIDLDPASCEVANQTVKASRFYSKEDDGIAQDWACTSMWLNPPYGKVNPRTGFLGSYQNFFTKKLIVEYKKGNVQQAILLLLGNSCFNGYFTPLWEYPLCFHDGTIFFARPDGTEGHYGFGTIFAYLGPHEQKFINTFSQFGRIAKAIDTPRCVEKPIPLWDVERIYA